MPETQNLKLQLRVGSHTIWLTAADDEGNRVDVAFVPRYTGSDLDITVAEIAEKHAEQFGGPKTPRTKDLKAKDVIAQLDGGAVIGEDLDVDGEQRATVLDAIQRAEKRERAAENGNGQADDDDDKNGAS